MIYLSLKHNGLGMKRFSDSAQEQKWGSLQRALTLGGDAGDAAHFLLTQTIAPHPNYHHFALSLREWGAEVGITLQRPLPPEPEDAHTMTNIIRTLQLDDADSDTYQAIFTDGSYTPAAISPRRITHVPSRLRWAHHGGAAVVWLPPEDEWQTGTTKILRLETPFSDVPGLGPYAYELMGAAMALILSARIHAHVPINTDYKAVCIRARKRHFPPDDEP